MNNPRSVLFNWALDRATSEPVALRAKIYRALAEYSQADDLEAAESRAREFAFKFSNTSTR